jgi:hypothetical protein
VVVFAGILIGWFFETRATGSEVVAVCAKSHPGLAKNAAPITVDFQMLTLGKLIKIVLPHVQSVLKSTV